ncbi:MAG: hypothetical protein J0M12_10910 [Deltaproteobacteria bacterium]|nr:hypothetical protein [Deltaproteobacteria bacterium]
MAAAQKSDGALQAIAVPHYSLRADAPFLISVLLIALVLRLDFLIANNFVIDADEAIVGLMAKHISEFKELPTFYYGQNYMGSLEPILTSIVFFFFGISSAALKAVPLFFSLVLILLIYQVGLELGNRGVARIAALLTALPPQLLVIWSSMARGGFVEVVCIGTLAIILTLRWIHAAAPRPSQTAWIGALLGLGWWVNNQIVYFALPIAFYMGALLIRRAAPSMQVRIKSVAVHTLAGIAAFFVGGFPYWVYNLQHDFVSFEIAKSATLSQMKDHVLGLGETALPMLLGARRQWHSEEVFAGAGMLVLALYGALFLIVLAKRWKQVLALPLLRVDRRQPVEFFFLFLALTFVVFAASSYGSLVESPRYLLPSYVGIFILSASGLSILYGYVRGVSYAMLAAIIAVNCCSWYLGGRALPGEPFVARGERVSKDQSQLIAWLQTHGYEVVRTNYWIGYRLAFESQEKIRFAIYQPPSTVRIAGYEAEARRRGLHTLPLVLVPSQAEIIRRALLVEGYNYREESLSGYVVFYDIAPKQSELSRVPLNVVTAYASDAPQNAALAVDGVLQTRWGSARPQAPGMQFTVELDKPRQLRGVRYELGTWPQDEPQSLGIELLLADGKKKVLLDPKDWDSVRFFREREPAILFTFDALPVKKVILTQNGEQKIFDWSIAELELLE